MAGKPTLTRYRLARRPLATAVCWCQVAIILVAVVGLPLPIPQFKDVSNPFPCLDRPCGCKTASDCWDHCCCFNDQQKLAWAAENGVEPPRFLVERVRREANPAGAACVAGSAKKPSCCQRKPAKSATASSAETEKRFISLLAERTCRGAGPIWGLSSLDWTLPAKVCLLPQPRWLIESRRLVDVSLIACRPMPEEPVPWMPQTLDIR